MAKAILDLFICLPAVIIFTTGVFILGYIMNNYEPSLRPGLVAVLDIFLTIWAISEYIIRVVMKI